MVTPFEYYKDEHVRERIKEYLKPSAAYIVGYGIPLLEGDKAFKSMHVSELEFLFNNSLDIFRSVWDLDSVLGILDIEYVNKKYPAEALFKPYEVFKKLEPVYSVTKSIFHSYNMDPLVVMTGQGYHFVFCVSRNTDAFKKLSKFNIPDTLKGKYSTTTKSRKIRVDIETGAAFEGMGRIMEFISHQIIKSLKGYEIPVHITDVASGTIDFISIDLSMYADPIYMRDIRSPFSTYQKHKVLWYKFGHDATRLPYFITLPRRFNSKEFDFETLIKMRMNYAMSAEFSRTAMVLIPDFSEQFEALLKAYYSSKTYSAHRYFYSQNQEPPHKWHITYDRYNPSELPPCVSHCLYEPNPHLLKPTNIQTLVRVLMKKGWHPMHIAGLMRSKFERNYNWGEEWYKYDANSRATGYVRFFSSLILAGVDTMVDLNCISHKEKGYCYKPFCGFNLINYKL